MTKPFILFQTDAIALASPSGRTSRRAKHTIISTLALTILLSSCATTQYGWDHPTNSEAQFTSDRAQCQYSAVTATGSYAPNNRGYQTSIGQAMADQYDIRSRQNEIFGLCMRARGYVWRAATP